MASLMKQSKENWGLHYTRLKGTALNPYNDYGVFSSVQLKELLSKFKSRLEDALECGFPIDYIPKADRCTLLQETIRFRCGSLYKDQFEAMINLLLDYGANVNVPSHGGWNALMYLISTLDRKYENFSNKLWLRIIEQTTDINTRDKRGYTAIDHTIFQYLHFRAPKQQDDYCVAEVKSKIVLLLRCGAETKEEIYRGHANATLGSEYFKAFKREASEEIIAYINNYIERESQMNNNTFNTPNWDYEI